MSEETREVRTFSELVGGSLGRASTKSVEDMAIDYMMGRINHMVHPTTEILNAFIAGYYAAVSEKPSSLEKKHATANVLKCLLGLDISRTQRAIMELELMNMGNEA